jgi:hypothetical protein
MRVLAKRDYWLSQNTRIIKRLYEIEKSPDFPDGEKFAIQYLFTKDSEWIEIARIDNYGYQKGKTGSHIHKLGLDDVEFRKFKFEEAEDYVIELGNRIVRERLMKGDENGQN